MIIIIINTSWNKKRNVGDDNDMIIDRNKEF